MKLNHAIVAKFYIANISFNALCEKKILEKKNLYSISFYFTFFHANMKINTNVYYQNCQSIILSFSEYSLNFPISLISPLVVLLHILSI